MYNLYLLEDVNSYKEYITNSNNKVQDILLLIKTYPEHIKEILSPEILSLIGHLSTVDSVINFIDYLVSFDTIEAQKTFIDNIIKISNPNIIISALEKSISIDNDTKKSFIIYIYKKYNIKIDDISDTVFEMIKNNAVFIDESIKQLNDNIIGNEIKEKRILFIISKGLKSEFTRKSLMDIFANGNHNIDNILYYFYESETDIASLSQFYNILLSFSAQRLYEFLKNSKNYNSIKYPHLLEDILVTGANLLNRDQALQLIRIAYQDGGETSLIISPKSIFSKIKDISKRAQIMDVITNNTLNENLTSKLYTKENFDIIHSLIFNKNFKKSAKQIVDTLQEIKNKSSENSIIFILIDLLKMYNSEHDFDNMDKVRTIIKLAYQYNILNNTVKFMYHLKNIMPNLKVWIKDNIFGYEPQNR